MLTYWTGLWGDKYPHSYVNALAQELGQHVALLDEFVAAPSDAPLWWQKLGWFGEVIRRPGRHVWVDLDSVVLGPPTAEIAALPPGELYLPRNWSRSRHGGFQSSLMVADDCEAVRVLAARAAYREDLWGDQEFITELHEAGEIAVQDVPAGVCVSYKYHCRGRGGPPKGAKIVTFHGKPDPHEVDDPWLRQAKARRT